MDRLDNVTVEGFGTYGDVLKHWLAIEPLIPKGVAQRVETRLNFKFTEPYQGGKQKLLGSGCEWSIAGINDFLEKCIKLRTKLNEAKREGINASEWDLWLKNILPSNKLGSDDRLTYRQIFEIIENEYYQGRHKFTGEKRSRESVSCQSSFQRTYTDYFVKCLNWDEYPDWDNAKAFWERFPENTCQYEALGKIKKIISYCPELTKKEILPKLNRIKVEKKRGENTKAIDWEQFFEWLQSQEKLVQEMPEKQAMAREGWLWIFKMCVAYGLRPAEIMSAINLFKPISNNEVKKLWGEKGKKYADSKGINPAFNDKVNNPKMLLILGNGFEVTDTSGKKHFITNKTGGRFCYPPCQNKVILNYLKLQNIPVQLPEYTPNANSKPRTIAGGFSNELGDKLQDWKCPTTQGYSFRHLGKMMGLLSGLPIGVIAKNMGHTELASEQFYNRQTMATANDLAEQATKYPLPYQVAIGELESSGFNLDDPSVKAILRIIYQLDD
ncbi:conserved hypothetical protein [Planktothrix sp. PCC 11201]|uniref:hypothetical protein n=1 Tax=Planktothrix sp. PCC 11201 TaxID=1729650 RepID=UPI0009241954|nr:hypothetical protein [Planktothrix sp. PCC 11201]SKB11419.1 conserved hypothetical protein [Planktothrix sp. PCC 11201]SKB12044.1 conserved hypothetical protein [Planktothrix sp. PCC 11201]